MADRRLPVSILTGFLGSGKTTLLSRLLAHPRMGETAVIVNELGDVAIDHHLLRRVDERTVLLASGCVCCSLRGDLADELRDLVERRARGAIPAFRRVVVETTGLADPAPILSTLASEPAVRHRYRLERVVTTVDAINGSRQLRRQREWVKQLAAADRIVVTKIDLAGSADVEALVERLRRLNPAASVHRASFGAVDPRQLFWASKVRAGAPRLFPETVDQDAQHVDGQGHDDGVRAFSLELEGPVDWTRFGIWLTMLLQSRGEDILRVKGLLDVGGPGPVLLNGVQHVVHRPEHLDRWPDGERRSRLVVIGRGVEPDALQRSLRAFARLDQPLALRA